MMQNNLKKRTNELWNLFQARGAKEDRISTLALIEQISFLIFSRFLDENEKENKKNNTNFKSIFSDNEQELRWSNYFRLNSDKMLPLIKNKVFPHFNTVKINNMNLSDFTNNAHLIIQKEPLLSTIMVFLVLMKDVSKQNNNEGEVYNYLLEKLSSGLMGQHRTSKQIMRIMVEILDPKPYETVADPVCGTGGSLVCVMEYLLEKYTSDKAIVHNTTGKKKDPGDLLEKKEKEHIKNTMFYGFDHNITMIRISFINLLLHGVDTPSIYYQDTLSNIFSNNFPQYAENSFDVILAHPPFEGSLEYDEVHPSLHRKLKTKKVDVLFVNLVLKMLKVGGRAAVIVPGEILFGLSKSHIYLRETLIEDNRLEGVISLPQTNAMRYHDFFAAILIFTKGGKTDNIFFYDACKDDKYEVIENNDISNIVDKWKNKNPGTDKNRTKDYFFIPKNEIKKNQYNLFIKLYKEIEKKYDSPKIILAKMKELENKIFSDINELEMMLK